jgi:hypothetical protein
VNQPTGRSKPAGGSSIDDLVNKYKDK